MPLYGGSIGSGYNQALNDISSRDAREQDVARSKQLQRFQEMAMEQQSQDRAAALRQQEMDRSTSGIMFGPPPVNQPAPGGQPGQASQPSPPMPPPQQGQPMPPPQQGQPPVSPKPTQGWLPQLNKGDGFDDGRQMSAMLLAGGTPKEKVLETMAQPQYKNLLSNQSKAHLDELIAKQKQGIPPTEPSQGQPPMGGPPGQPSPPMGITSQPNPPQSQQQGSPITPPNSGGQSGLKGDGLDDGRIIAKRLLDAGVPPQQILERMNRPDIKNFLSEASKRMVEQRLAAQAQETGRHNVATETAATARDATTSARDKETARYHTGELAARGRTESRLAAADAAKSGGPAKADPLANIPPEKDKELRIQAWNYINGKGLPYRKGSGGGADRNDSVMAMASKISNELDIPPQELAGKSASFKADAMSFGNLSKKADVIEAQLQSFHNNLETWDTLAKGQGLKLGSAGSKQLASMLGKINFTGIKSLDEIKMRIQQEVNDPAAVAVLTAASAAAFDYARIMSSQGQSAGQITDSARAEAQRLVSSAYSDKSRAALMATLDSDTAGQIKGLIDQKDKAYGRLTGKGAAKPTSGGIPQGWSVKER